MDEIGTAQDKIVDKKAFFIIGIFFGILVLLAVTFMFLSNTKKNDLLQSIGLFTGPTDNTTVTPVLSPTAGAPPNFPPPPKLVTDQWAIDLSQPPANIIASNLYTFKQNYTVEEVKTFAQKLFQPQEYSTADNQLIAYSYNNASRDTEILRFNTQSGAFSYLSTLGISVPASQEANLSNDTVYAFLRNLGIYDPTMQVTARYANTANPQLTYIELHRDWRKAGLPILNFLGLTNLPDTQKLSDLSLNSTVGALADPAIISATDGKNGLARQKDFNTLTLIYNPGTGKIIAMESTIRQLQGTTTANLISLAEAEELLKSGGYEMGFLTPADQNAADWNTHYPDNIADATSTTITESIYTYIEQPPLVTQSQLKPYVLFRGYATLKNGYKSNFIAAVPAVQNAVLGAETARYLAANKNTPTPDTAGKQTIVTPPPGKPNKKTPTPKASQTTPVPIPSIAPECSQDHFRIGPIDQAVEYMGVLMVHSPYFEYQKWMDGQWTSQWFRETNGPHGDWYYLPKEGYSAGRLTEVLQMIFTYFDGFMKAIGYSGGEGFRNQGLDWVAIWNDINGTWGDARFTYNPKYNCPIRLTGHTPSIFLYGKNGQTVTVNPSQVFYADPQLKDGRWNVTINKPLELTVNGTVRPYLYYEYASVSFARPKTGWVVEKTQLNVFADKMAAGFGLTAAEKDRLEVDLKDAAERQSADSLFIGLVDNNEVNKKLPLKLAPAPDTLHRLFFYVGESNGKAVAPKVTPLQRSGLTAIEIGIF